MGVGKGEAQGQHRIAVRCGEVSPHDVVQARLGVHAISAVPS
jgi:hypothetical protein